MLQKIIIFSVFFSLSSILGSQTSHELLAPVPCNIYADCKEVQEIRHRNVILYAGQWGFETEDSIDPRFREPHWVTLEYNGRTQQGVLYRKQEPIGHVKISPKKLLSVVNAIKEDSEGSELMLNEEHTFKKSFYIISNTPHNSGYSQLFYKVNALNIMEFAKTEDTAPSYDNKTPDNLLNLAPQDVTPEYNNKEIKKNRNFIINSLLKNLAAGLIVGFGTLYVLTKILRYNELECISK